MTNHRPGYSIARAIIIMVCVAALLSLFGCASEPKSMLSYKELASQITVTKQEYVTLHTGQVCEVKDMKIVACDRDPSLYAETVEDIEAIVGEE